MSVRPKKRLGQHFLTDPNTIRRIADAVQAPEGSPVVEIGPGEGALTAELLRRYPDLVALEVDPEALAHLRERFSGLDVREGDVLDVDWPALHAGLSRPAGESSPPAGSELRVESPESKGEQLRNPSKEPESSGRLVQPPAPSPQSPVPPLSVVGNLPYYITSPILFALLDARAHVGRAVVMVQKEVAERLASPHGSKVYGTLSVYFQLYADVRVLFPVSRHVFRPKPDVESAVVAIDFAGTEPPEVDFRLLRRVVRAAFGQRRKMLRNSVAPLAVESGVEVPGWAATLRPEALAPADFVRLTHDLFPRA